MARMKLLALSLTMLLSSGCVVSRTIAFPGSTPSLNAPEVSVQWRVSEVFVRAAAANPDNRDYGPLKAQLADRLRKTLEAQAGLGHRLDAPGLGMELSVDVTERSSISPWFGLGAGLETGALLGGGMLGVLIGGSAAGPIGVVAAAPLAVTLALLPPTSRETGEFEVTLTLRRPDGAVVAARHVRHEWKAELNGFYVEKKLAEESGSAVPQLEQALLELVRDVMRDQSRSALMAAPIG
jgi:hypothetical protein